MSSSRIVRRLVGIPWPPLLGVMLILSLSVALLVRRTIQDPESKTAGPLSILVSGDIGHRSRIWILDEIIRIARAKPDVWIATHAEIAQYCADQAGLRRP